MIIDGKSIFCFNPAEKMTHFSDVVNAAMDVNKAKKEIMRTNENRLMKADGLRNRISQSWLLMENEMGILSWPKLPMTQLSEGTSETQKQKELHSLSMYIYFLLCWFNIEPEK